MVTSQLRGKRKGRQKKVVGGYNKATTCLVRRVIPSFVASIRDNHSGVLISRCFKYQCIPSSHASMHATRHFSAVLYWYLVQIDFQAVLSELRLQALGHFL
jgi:hypothetical protein